MEQMLDSDDDSDIDSDEDWEEDSDSEDQGQRPSQKLFVRYLRERQRNKKTTDRFG